MFKLNNNKIKWGRNICRVSINYYDSNDYISVIIIDKLGEDIMDLSTNLDSTLLRDSHIFVKEGADEEICSVLLVQLGHLESTIFKETIWI